MKVVTYEGIVENRCVHLPPEADIPENSKVYIVVPGPDAQQMARIWSPRLVNPEQAKDFIKEVVPEKNDA